MTEKRYYKKDWEESYYIFDSNTISEDEFEERVECEGYDVFVDSLTGSEIIGLLNENEQLKQFQEQVAEVIESKMGDNVCNDYKMEVLKEIWNELELDEVWFE